jgi:hypothetical protein
MVMRASVFSFGSSVCLPMKKRTNTDSVPFDAGIETAAARAISDRRD